MTRGDFWCRVLGWLQLGGAVATGLCIYALWSLFFGWIELNDDGFFDVIMWLIIIVMAFPPFLAGVLTLVFADHVEQARNGKRDEQHVVFRVFTALAGLWSAGVIGILGISMPALGFFAILGIATAAVAIMGPDWTADLFTPSGVSA
jgi:hypothetical protein